ncbi:PAS domain S-box protein [Paenibacillus sp. TRM 82003]|nr:PAS domain S-box protein [Paenibacillus sp. TRM 82003]
MLPADGIPPWELTERCVKPIDLQMIRLDKVTLDIEAREIYSAQGDSILFYFQDVTAKRRAEQAIKESEEHYRRLVEQSPLPMAMHRNGHLTYINQSGLALFGVTNIDQMLGVSVYSFMNSENKALARANREKLLSGEPTTSFEIRLDYMPYGPVELEVVSSYNAQNDTYQFLFHDVTSRKKAERALRDSEERYRRLVEMSPQAIFVFRDTRFVFLNMAATRLFGAESPEQLIGTDVFNMIGKSHHIMTWERIHALESGIEIQTAERRVRRLDGVEIDVESVGCSITFEGRPAVMVCARDITERKEMERQRLEAQRRLRDSEARYFRLQDSLDRFSRDLTGVLEMGELERRLVKEASVVLAVQAVTVVEVSKEGDFRIRAGNGGISEAMREAIAAHNAPAFPQDILFRSKDGWFVKIGESGKHVIYLCIDEPSERLSLQPKRKWLRTLSRFVNVLYDNFRVIEDLTSGLEVTASKQASPPWLLRLLFILSENERKRLAQDLHDAALQEQIIYYRKLEVALEDASLSSSVRTQLETVREGLLDVIYQIRLTCNELRPPLLKDFGLVSSLESLIQTVQLRNDYLIRFTAEYAHEQDDETTLALYRIVQEMLANASKHSNATEVRLSIAAEPETVTLRYTDNGVGMDIALLQEHYGSMGVYGIRERVRSLNGSIEFRSSPMEGLQIEVMLPAMPTET